MDTRNDRLEDRIQPTEEDGYEALRGHLVERALLARERHGPVIDLPALRRLLEDRELVRFPVQLRFADEPLMRGEFAHAAPLGQRAADGFELCVRPCFRDDEAAVVALALYHVPTVNYLDVVTHVEAELFGAAVLGLEVEQYYARICELADSMPPEFRVSQAELAEADAMRRHLEGEAPEASPMAPPPAAGPADSGCCGGGTCG